MILKGKFSRFGVLYGRATRFPVAARGRFVGDGYTNGLNGDDGSADLIIDPNGINYAFNVDVGVEGFFALKDKNNTTQCFNLQAYEFQPSVTLDNAIIAMTLDTTIIYPSVVDSVGYGWEFTSTGLLKIENTAETRYHTIYAYNGDLVFSEAFTFEGLLVPPVPGEGVNYKFSNRIFYLKDYLTGEWKVPWGVMIDGVMTIELT